jgi:hypothetical protein
MPGLTEYAIVGCIERASPKNGYDKANAGIFGGWTRKRVAETTLSCGIRNMESKFFYEFDSKTKGVTNLSAQMKLRSDLGVRTLPMTMEFRGKLKGQNPENMQAWILIFPNYLTPQSSEHTDSSFVPGPAQSKPSQLCDSMSSVSLNTANGGGGGGGLAATGCEVLLERPAEDPDEGFGVLDGGDDGVVCGGERGGEVVATGVSVCRQRPAGDPDESFGV